MLVDDDEILRKFLQVCLGHHGYNAMCFPDGDNLPKLLDQGGVDLIVLDVMLPGKDGIYWLKWLQQYHPYVPVILVSAKASEDDRLHGLEFGARDYVVKPFRDKELLIRIGNILKERSTTQDHSELQIGNILFSVDNSCVMKDNAEVRLTTLEANILQLLYLNAGAVVSRDEIMTQLRGAEHNPLDRSIDIHINKLRKKIEDDPSNPALIRTVRGKGYRLHNPALCA